MTPLIERAKNRVESIDWLARIVRGSYWHSIGIVGAKVLMLAMNFIMARLLGSEGYGRLNFVQSTINTSASIASFGLAMATTKHVAQYRSSLKDLSGVITLSLLLVVVTGLLIGLSLFFFADSLSILLLTEAEAPYLRFAGICVVFSVLTMIFNSILAGLEKFRENTRLQLISTVVLVGMVVASGYLFGTEAAIMALVTGVIFTSLLYIFVLWRIFANYHMQFSIKEAGQKLEIVYRYSLPAFWSGFAVAASTWYVHTTVISAVGFDGFGVFVAANQFFLLIATLNRIFSYVVLPVYISHAEKKETSRGFEVFNLGFSWIMAVVIVGVVSLLSGYIAFLLGADYQVPEWDKIMALVLLSATIVAHQQGMIRILLEKGLMWLNALGHTVWAITLLVVSAQLLEYGALGLAISIVVAYATNALVVFSIFLYKGIVPRFFLFSAGPLIIWAGVFLISFAPWIEIDSLGVTLLKLAGFAFALVGSWLYSRQSKTVDL